MIMLYRAVSLGLVCGLVPFAAFAKDATDGKSADIAAEKVICERFFVKADNHAADYTPAVDVNGHAVVGADINATPPIIPEYISMPLTINFAAKLQKNLPQGMELKPSMGNLKLYPNGKIEFNGQDITKSVAGTCGVDPAHFSVQEERVEVPQEEQAAEAPLAGSVVPSTTGPQPRRHFGFPKGAVNISDMPSMDNLVKE